MLRNRSGILRTLNAHYDPYFRNILYDLGNAGFARIESYLPEELFSELCLEASSLKPTAKPVYSESDIKYQASLKDLGEKGKAFLNSLWMADLINTLFKTKLTPDSKASCYTYYKEGDFLSPHLDHPEQCIVTTILYLDATSNPSPTGKTGLELHLYENEMLLSARRPSATIPTIKGELLVGLGSQTWHERPMLQAGELVTAITACYSYATKIKSASALSGVT